jgi:uncharacterized protein YjdB
VTGVLAGTATITATSEAKSGTAAVTVAATATKPGTVTNVAVAGVTSNSVTLSFTEVNDGTGQPASYAVRWAAGTMSWGSANDVVQGTCRVPMAGTTIGATRTCSVLGLVPSTSYQFQLVPFRGTLNLNAVFGVLSNVTSGATAAASLLPVASVGVSPASASVTAGQSAQLTATLRDASGNVLGGRVVTWGSGNTGVATVDGSGFVTSAAVGVAIITATSEGQSGTAAVTVTAAPPPGTTWPNEPVGWNVFSDYNADATSAGGWNTSGVVTVVSDPTAPLSPPSVWQFAFPVGFTGGGSPGMEWRPLPSTSAIYVGFWWKPSNPWQNHSSNVNKLFLVMDDMRPNFGSYWIRMLGPAPYHTYVQVEYDQPTVNYDENVDTTPVTLGQWHQVEFYLNRNGGILKWWMDGKLKGSYSGIYFAGTAFGTEVHLQPIWGGIGETKTENDYFWFDHVHVSTP